MESSKVVYKYIVKDIYESDGFVTLEDAMEDAKIYLNEHVSVPSVYFVKLTETICELDLLLLNKN